MHKNVYTYGCVDEIGTERTTIIIETIWDRVYVDSESFDDGKDKK